MEPDWNRRPDHTSRGQRLLKFLHPEAHPLDDRDEQALLSYAARFAEIVQFGSKGDQGTWTPFLTSDVSFFTACLLEIDARGLYRKARFLCRDQTDSPARDAAKELGCILDNLDKRDLSKLRTIPYERGTLEVRARNACAEIRQALDAFVNCLDEPPSNSASKIMLPEDQHRSLSQLSRTIERVQGELREVLQNSLTAKSDHAPQVGLYLAFTALLRKAQGHANDLTGRHLDHYYQRVLRLQPHEGHPDHTHFAFEIPSDLKDVVLPEGTTLAITPPEGGAPISFETDYPMSLSRARVTTLHSLGWANADSGRFVARHLQVTDAQDANQLPEFAMSEEAKNLPVEPFVGLAVESAIFATSGGVRSYVVAFDFSKSDADVILEPQGSWFGLAIDTEQDPLRAQITSCDQTQTTETLRVTLGFTLPADAPATKAAARLPRLFLQFNLSTMGAAWAAFSKLAVQKVHASLSVRGAQGIQASNNDGALDVGRPFMPFGFQPMRNARFTLGCDDFAGKTLSSLNVKFDWSNLPSAEGGFATYFEGYPGSFATESFQVALEQKRREGWRGLTLEDGGRSAPLFRDTATGMDGNWLNATDLPPTDTQERSFRLSLTAPQMGFGRESFPNAVFAAAVGDNPGEDEKLGDSAKDRLEKPALKALAEAAKDSLAFIRRNRPKPQPKQPFTPEAEGLKLNYAARTDIVLTAEEDSQRIWAVTPFGEHRLTPDNNTLDEAFLVGDAINGTAVQFVGIEGARPGETLHLYFRCAEPSGADWAELTSDKAIGAPWCQAARQGWTLDDTGSTETALWHCLTSDGWKVLPDDALHTDGTDGLTRSGIAMVTLPGAASAKRSEMPQGLHWFAVRTTAANLGITGVFAQSVAATRRQEETGVGWINAVPEGWSVTVQGADISRRVASVRLIGKSEGGRPAETRTQFRARVSERLRHKNRAWQAADYEQLVLEQFPDLHDVRCMPIGPGAITLVVAPRRKSGTHRIPTIPGHRIRQIAENLSTQVTHTGVRIRVQQVRTEFIRVAAKITPEPTALSDFAAYVDDWLARRIAPWSFDPDQPLPLGQALLDADALRHALQQDSRVKDVSAVSLVKFFNRGLQNDALQGGSDWAETSGALLSDTAPIGSETTPQALEPSGLDAVFVPWKRHLLQLSPLSIEGRAKPAGIGNLRIGDELRIGRAVRRDLSEPIEI